VERVLLETFESLGFRICRPHKVVGLKAVAGGQMEVTFDGGETITAKYVIGSDGARSSVRQLAGIGFADPPNPEASADAIEGTVTGDGAFLIIPLPNAWSKDKPGVQPDERVYRIVFVVPIPDGSPPHDLPIDYIQKYVDRSGPKNLSSDPLTNPDPVRVSRKIWASRFRSHSAIADQFYTRFQPGVDNDTDLGRTIFLLGDAARTCI